MTLLLAEDDALDAIADGPLQSLFAVMVRLELLGRRLDPTSAGELDGLLRAGRRAVGEIAERTADADRRHGQPPLYEVVNRPRWAAGPAGLR